MQIILVVGGAGFIGSHLCKKLLDNGFSVIAIDNFITGNKSNISDILENPSFSFIEHDVVKGKTKIPKIDYVFHLASPASPNKKSPRSYIAFPIETMLVNSIGTYNLLQLALEDNATFVFASTSEIYGDPEISPQAEDYFGNVNPNGVRSVYDEAKRFGEAMVMAYVRKYNIDARIIRIFNTYGPKMQKDDGRVVSNFINQALVNASLTIYGDGTQTRSFCYVDDMVDGLYKAMFADNIKGEVINLGNPDERTILELATIVKEMTQSSSGIIFEELPQDDPKARHPDISKAEKLLGWKPEVSLTSGLKKTIAYFKQI